MSTETTLDSLFGGDLRFYQPARGYRVNIDTLFLAAFAAERLAGPSTDRRPRAELVLDLGCGVGAATLCLSRLVEIGRAVLVDRSPGLLELARRNLDLAGVPGSVLSADVARGCPPGLAGRAALVLANPPFFPSDLRGSPREAVRRARCGRVEPFLAVASAAVRGPRARAAFVYPAQSLEAFLAHASSTGLVAKRVRFVHASVGRAARVVLVELRRARPGGLVVEPPLFEWSAPGARAPEVLNLLSARAADRS